MTMENLFTHQPNLQMRWATAENLDQPENRLPALPSVATRTANCQ